VQLQKYEEEQKKYAHEDKKKFYSGKGLVFMGTFYSVNRLHDTKQASGIYQAVQVCGPDSLVPRWLHISSVCGAQS
jgi:hypothetical protein